MNQSERIIKVDGMPLGAGFNWSVGVLMEKFMAALAGKKLLAGKCPKCAYVVTPPRTRCPKCNGKIGEADLIELSGKGRLLGKTVTGVKLDGKCNFAPLPKAMVIAAVKLDGADSTLFLPLDADPAKAAIGAAVSVQWSAETKGEISDIKCLQLD